LFVEPTLEQITAVLGAVRLDVLQIYGALDNLAAIKIRFGLPVWRATGVGNSADLPTSALGADGLLLEAKPPQGASRPGGNAATFDWTILRGWDAPAPWMLAGGLTPANVAAAIRETGAQAVDVSSGVEKSKGVKDAALIRAFIAAAKGAG
jgi:phosphoribosylanthranilate isomerase